MNRISALIFATALAAAAKPAMAEINVAVSIKPIHSLVAAVMEGAGTPALLVPGAASPHAFALKPAEAQALQTAKVVFWIGRNMEAFLVKPLETLPAGTRVVTLGESAGLNVLAVREGVGFAPDEQEGEEGKTERDPHSWLDPRNAAVMVDEIAASLSTADPTNAQVYEKNARAAKERLRALETELAGELAALKGRNYIVFHDAFQYFEKRFGIPAAGAISIHPENPPGARAIRDLRQRLAAENIRCVFSEPQFDPRLVNVIIEGTEVKTGVLDAEAGTLEPGPALYEQLLRNLVASLKACLG